MSEGSNQPECGRWYRWGRIVLYSEMMIAIVVTIFALYLAFTGQGWFLA